MALMAFGLWIALLVPHALHLREEHLGTLGDLRALPVSEGQFVAFRFLEGLLSALLVLAIHLLLLRAMQGAGAWSALKGWLSPGWLWMLLLFLAIPMPITLRWGVRGWVVLVIGAFLCFGASVAFVQLTGRLPLAARLAERLIRLLLHLIEHPFQHTVVLLGLSLVCVPLSITGLRRRD